jgi:hypothetical protein
MMVSGMYLAFAVGGNPVVSILGGVLARLRLVREADKPASLARRNEEGGHFLMVLVCPAAGPVAGRVGGAEVNPVARTSASFAAADSEGGTQPEL